MSIQAVLWDMDGVLLDSEAYWFQSRIEFAAALGKAWTMDDQRLAMGRSTIEWARVMQERLALDLSLDEIMDDVIRRIMGKLDQRLPELPGALDAVKLTARHFPIALASGSPTRVIDHVMRLMNLEDVFKVRVYGDDMRNGKPDPEIWLTAADRLGVDIKRCAGIEDSGNGVRSLHAAGTRIIAVPSPGFTLPPDVLALAHHVLPSLEHLTLDLLR
ncbi:MAG: HAD family phosphatase [Anaerolinea sp.]|nr:HAD family phosphatase [Anaerolinea sp.]